MLKTTILKKIIGTLLAALLTTGTGVGVSTAINNESLNNAKETLNNIVNEVSVDDVKAAGDELASELTTGSNQANDSATIETTSVPVTNNVNNAAQKTPANIATESDTKSDVNYAAVQSNSAPSNEVANKAVESKSIKSPVRNTSGSLDASLARQAFDLINNYRVSEGLAALSWSDSDAAVASVRAKEIASNFSHTSASGTKTNGGENIAVTYGGTADEVVNGWINSSGHRANILRESAVSAGLAVYVINGQYFWSNNFTKSNEIPKANAENTTTTWENVNGKEVQVITDNDGNICVDGGAIKRDAEGWADGHFEIREISDEDAFGDGSLILKTATVDAVFDTGIQFVRFGITAGEKGIAVLGDNNLKITWNDVNSGRPFQVKGDWTEVRWK